MCDIIDAKQLNFDQNNLILLNCLLAFLMFGIALDLKVEHFKRLIQYPRKAIAGILSQYVLLPFLTYLIVIILQPCPSIALGIFLLGACPGGNMSNFLSSLAKGNVALSVTLTATSTLLAPIMTPLNFAFYGGLYPPTAELMQEISVEPMELFTTIVVILGVPLIIGMLVNHFMPKFTALIRRPVQIVSVIIFLCFIVFAFLKNYDLFMEIIGMIFLLVLLHNGLAMLGGYGLGALFKLDFADKKCLSIETGIHNAALGLIIIFSFFKGLGGMAVVAGWWGIWDLVTGFIIATYWSRMAAKKTLQT
ncbi:MAG TPA: bile acid:sodium symporter family protein [Chitinophagales bacterium]|nr:bile acid:sodium symporter family protein [Chitinophagales bacterium]